MRKPAGWPRYMKEKALKSGRIAYYWYPHPRDIKAGFPIKCEALGGNYARSIARAAFLNQHLDDWRDSRGAAKTEIARTSYGTVAWLFNRYLKSPAFEKRVSERSRYEYRRALARIEDVPTAVGLRVAELPVDSITEAAVDKIYAEVQQGPRGIRIRQANLSIDIARRAWEVVRRLAPDVVPDRNPWVGVVRDTLKRTKPYATRTEAYTLAAKLKEMGEPALGVAALICYEWLQRPENVLGGKITWADYRPDTFPNDVRIFHHKTGAEVWLPLNDAEGSLYPELEAALAELPRLGLPIVLTNGLRGPSRPYAFAYAQRRVREARKAAALGDHVTLDACRHGGMTELGDAELTEQGIMTLSGHKTPQAARPYVKRTKQQRASAARRRRNYIEEVG